MASEPVQSREFRSVEGPVAIGVDVARYCDAHPLQLAHDFSEESQPRLWRYIGRLLDEADAGTAPARRPGGPEEVQAPALSDVVEALAGPEQLPLPVRSAWARREASRVLRARQLGLPEEPPLMFASETEVRRARMRVV